MTKKIRFTVAPIVTKLNIPKSAKASNNTTATKANQPLVKIKAEARGATAKSDALLKHNVAVSHTPAIVVDAPDTLIVSGKVLESSTVNEAIKGRYLPQDGFVSDVIHSHPTLAKLISSKIADEVLFQMAKQLIDTSMTYETLLFTFERWLDDQGSVSEELSTLFNKALLDTLHTTEELITQVVKNVQDTGTLSEIIAVNTSAIRFDNAKLLEQLRIEVSRLLELDNSSASDSVSLHPTPSAKDESHAEENIFSNVSLTLKDFPVSSHRLSTEVSSLVKDSTETNVSVKFDADKSLVDDGGHSTDSLSINPEPNVFDVAHTSEMLHFGLLSERISQAVCTVSYFGEFSKGNEAQFIELLKFDADKRLESDNAHTSDSVKLHLTLHLYDLVHISESVDTLLVPEIKRWYDSGMSTSEALSAALTVLKFEELHTEDSIKIGFEKPYAHITEAAMALHSDIDFLKVKLTDVFEELRFGVFKPLAHNSSALSQGKAVIQNYYADDYYWEDFHGSSHSSIG